MKFGIYGIRRPIFSTVQVLLWGLMTFSEIYECGALILFFLLYSGEPTPTFLQVETTFVHYRGFLVYSASPTAVHYRGFSVYSARASPHFAFRVAPAMHVYVYFFIYLWHGL